jgi:hypothetical protein
MNVSMLIPLVGELMKLGFEIADLIERSEDVNPEDKEAMKVAIKKAQEGVTFWESSPGAKESAEAIEVTDAPSK